MPYRGSYQFEVNEKGNLLYTTNNVELLRNLWLDRKLLAPNELGPGDPGDFDNGAWHVACHLVAAGGVRRFKDGRLLWLEISYDPITGIYKPTLTVREFNKVETIEINSIKAQEYIKDSGLLGFVEGTSQGRIAAKGIEDDEKLFNCNPRQEYDQKPGTLKEGGRVWEHWCTTRDIRETNLIGSSVLDSYISLSAVLGNKFITTVARGRKYYNHPAQLKALIKSGFVSSESASLNIKPTPIPAEVELLFQEADPQLSLLAVEKLNWEFLPKYYMFQRGISGWNNESVL